MAHIEVKQNSCWGTVRVLILLPHTDIPQQHLHQPAFINIPQQRRHQPALINIPQQRLHQPAFINIPQQRLRQSAFINIPQQRLRQPAFINIPQQRLHQPVFTVWKMICFLVKHGTCMTDCWIPDQGNPKLKTRSIDVRVIQVYAPPSVGD